MRHILRNRPQRDRECAACLGKENLRVVIGIPVGDAGDLRAVFDGNGKPASIG